MTVALSQMAWSYYLWVLALSLSITTIVVLFKFALSKKGLLSKSSMFLASGFTLWTFAIIVHVIEHPILEWDMYISIFTYFIGSLYMAYLAYYQEQVTHFLQTIKQKRIKPKITKISLYLGIVMAFMGAARFFLGIDLLNAMYEGMSIITAIALLLVGISLLPQLLPKKFKRIPKETVYLPFIMGIMALVGHFLNFPLLYAPIPGGGTSIPTAISILALCMALLTFPYNNNLKVRMVGWGLINAAILFASLGLVGHVFNLPVLYGAEFFARLSIPTAITILLILFGMFHPSNNTKL